jgi:hypothetical protein
VGLLKYQETKMNTDELLSLDILNFVPVTDLNYYIRWIEQNVQYLCELYLI